MYIYLTFRVLCSFATVLMAEKYPPKGRGRGRGRLHTTEGDFSTDIVPPPTIPKTTDVETTSKTDTAQTLATSPATTAIGRGRGRRTVRKVEVDVPDPEWTVSDLSKDDFQTKTRPSKPSEVGTIGEQITVLVNYFPVVKFPQEGIAYQYDIEIKNKNDRLVRRDHQRYTIILIFHSNISVVLALFTTPG